MKHFAALAIERLGLSVEQVRDVVWLSQFGLPGRSAAGAAASGPSPAVTALPPPAPNTPEPAVPTTTPTPVTPTGTVEAPRPLNLVASARGRGGGADTPRLQAAPAAALVRRGDIARALRPLGWRTARPNRFRVVESATANRIADTGIWAPVLAPETEPALDLAVVLDVDQMLRPWREVIRSLVQVARTSGMLRDVTVWTIGADGDGIVLRRGARGAPRRNPRHMFDPSGRTAIIVVSDFSAPMWRSAEGLHWLRTWAARSITSLVTLYPPRLWRRTLLGMLATTRLRARRRGQPSATLIGEPNDREAVPLPVITIEPASIAAWARQVAGDDRERTVGVLALEDLSLDRRARFTVRVSLGGQLPNDETFAELVDAARAMLVDDPAPTTPAERVAAFARGTRPEVVRLASALARSPLRLDVVRVVQRALAPRTGPLELAEVLGSSLFTLASSGAHDSEVWFMLEPNVRKLLAELTPGRDGLRVLEAVGAYVRDKLGTGFDLETLLINPSGPLTLLPDEFQPFGRIFVEELERLGGRYRTLAARLKSPAPPMPLRTPDPATYAPRFAALGIRESAMPRRTFIGHSLAVTGCAVTPDGTRVVSASDDKTLKVWDLETGRMLATLQGHTLPVTGCAVTPDGIRVVSASDDKTLKVWDLETGREFATLLGHGDKVSGCVVTPNGTHVVSASHDKTLKVWDFKTGRELSTLQGHGNMVSGCVVTADGTRVISASDDKTLKVWDLETGRVLASMQGHTGAVRACAVTSDGSRVISASDDKTLKVWDLEAGRALATLQGHTESVSACAVSPDGTCVVSVSDDETLKVWNIESGVCLLTHRSRTACNAVVATAARIIVGDDDGTLWLLDWQSPHDLARPGVGDISPMPAISTDAVHPGPAAEVASAPRDVRSSSGLGRTKHIILFLAANPIGLSRLGLDQEARAISDELDRSSARDQFELVTRWAVQPMDLVRELWKLQPTVVHFSGSGTAEGLYFRAEDGGDTLVSPRALADVFTAAGTSVKLVVLSGCFSEQQARALLPCVGCVVGLDGNVTDSDARNYAIGFYSALGANRSVAAAHALGRAFLSINGLETQTHPQLLVRDDVDASALVLSAPGPIERLGRSTISPRGNAATSAADAASLHSRRLDWRASSNAAMAKQTILFLAASPMSLAPLALDEEARAIGAELDRGNARNHFELVTRWAVRPIDFFRELQRLRPAVVHFSGHSTAAGLYFDTEDGTGTLVSPSALADTFGAVGASVNLVVLSGCYTEQHARALLPLVGCVVGSSGSISNEDVRDYARIFYGAIGDNLSVADAHAHACASLVLKGLEAGALPQMLVHADVDAAALVLSTTDQRERPVPSAATTRVGPALFATGIGFPHKVDVAIVANRRDELRALMDVFPEATGTIQGSHHKYIVRRADAGQGEHYSIAVVHHVEQGIHDAQTLARDLIDDLNPRLILAVGIAGGLPSDDLTLGDVVVSTRIHDFLVEASKPGSAAAYVTAGGPIDKALADAVAHLANHELGDWTADLPERPPVSWKTKEQLYGPPEWQRELREKLEHHYPQGAPSRVPLYMTGAIASSERLVKNSEILIPWLQTARNLLAVEIEAAGVYRAVGERCPMLAIRGLSDLVGLKRADAWTKYACASAAAFTRAFLRTRPVPIGASTAPR